ncbi:MAG: ATP-binding cassette domain-containing protein, partial [Clostridiales bacterium]|nr:ATP-binding cassette domain-containing protein [Clostridiales bacterium]
MGEQAILEAKNLSKTFSGICVLNNVNFRLAKGEVHALVGENGAGKSTMIKLIAGVERPDEGSEIYFDGVHIPRMSANKSIALGISVIYQDISLFPNLSIAENITKGMFREFIFNKKKAKALAQKALETMRVKLDLDSKLADVSVGKQQLVAIARAITFHSKVIVM